MSNRLAGRVAVVTGAASGIGRAISHRFVEEGALVVAVDVDVAALATLHSDLGEVCRTVVANVTIEAEMQHAMSYAVQVFGRLDIAVANAGGGAFSPIHEHPLSEWQRIIDLCLTGVFITVKHASATMLDLGTPGSIITVASLNAVQPAQGMAAYGAAKAGVVMLSQIAALELGPRSIRVNTIAPGLIETPATGGFFSAPGIVDDFVANTPIGRYGQPGDIANLALFLASDEASFITGAVHHIDGGAQTGRYPRLFDHLAES